MSGRAIDWEKWLDEVESLRYSDAKAAFARLRASWSDVPVPLVAKQLGVLSSVLRMLEAHRAALRAVNTGIKIADSDYATRGTLLQRKAYIKADVAEYRQALAISKQALESFALVGDFEGIGKALFDRGQFTFYLDDPRGAIRFFKSSLKYFAGRLPRSRFSALMNLGYCYLELGDIEQASQFSALADEIEESVGTWLRAKLTVLIARIQCRRGLLSEARVNFKAAISQIEPISTVEAALVWIDLIETLQDNPAAQAESAKAMTRLVIPLAGNPIAEGVVASLVRKALTYST